MRQTAITPRRRINIEEIERDGFSKEESIINPIFPLSHLLRVELTKEVDSKYWRSGRKLMLKKEEYLEPKLINKDDIESFEKYVLVLGEQRSIMGIGELDEQLTINPKVVFNAIG